MTKAEAKKLCVKKWEWLTKNGGEKSCWGILPDKALGQMPELKRFPSNCAYCGKYFVRGKNRFKEKCGKCPLFKSTKRSCFSRFSLFAKVEDNKTAQKMLAAIRKS